MTSLNDTLTPPPVLKSLDEERAFLLLPPKHNINTEEKLGKVKVIPSPSRESTPGLGLKASEKPGGKIVGAPEEVRERIRQLERDYTSRGLVSSAMARAGQEMEVQIVEGRNTPSLQPVPRLASTVATFPRPRADLMELPADLQRLARELGQPGLPLLSASMVGKKLDYCFLSTANYPLPGCGKSPELPCPNGAPGTSSPGSSPRLAPLRSPAAPQHCFTCSRLPLQGRG